MKEAAAAAVVTTAANRKEIMEAATVAAAADERRGCAVVAVKRKAFVDFSGSQRSFGRLCSHVGCLKSVHNNEVCLQRAWPEVQLRGMHQGSHL